MLSRRLTASATLHARCLASTTLVSITGASAVLRKPQGRLTIEAASGALRAQLAPFFVGAKGDKGDQGNPGTGGGTVLQSPHLIWANGLLVRVEYAGGQTKALQWASGRLQYVDSFDGVATTRKTLAYNGAGQLVDVVQSGVGA